MIFRLCASSTVTVGCVLFVGTMTALTWRMCAINYSYVPTADL
jgi:hypothetical protein